MCGAVLQFLLAALKADADGRPESVMTSQSLGQNARHNAVVRRGVING